MSKQFLRGGRTPLKILFQRRSDVETGYRNEGIKFINIHDQDGDLSIVRTFIVKS